MDKRDEINSSLTQFYYNHLSHFSLTEIDDTDDTDRPF